MPEHTHNFDAVDLLRETNRVAAFRLLGPTVLWDPARHGRVLPLIIDPRSDAWGERVDAGNDPWGVPSRIWRQAVGDQGVRGVELDGTEIALGPIPIEHLLVDLSHPAGQLAVLIAVLRAYGPVTIDGPTLLWDADDGWVAVPRSRDITLSRRTGRDGEVVLNIRDMSLSTGHVLARAWGAAREMPVAPP